MGGPWIPAEPRVGESRCSSPLSPAPCHGIRARRPSPQLSLPTLSTCKSAAPPALPKRWHAVGLMSPFLEGQLDIGDFVYDATVPAMRATVYGLESGAADLLITDTNTYQLSGPYGAPTSCATLDHKFNLPS